MGCLRIGCCGFPVAKKRYFELFDTVEVQATFYQPPDLRLAKKWRQEAPSVFEYTMKAWQLITHEPESPTYRRLKEKIPEGKKKYYGSFKPTDEVHYAWERTREWAIELGSRFIVFQCPASFGPTAGNKKNLRRFFAEIKREGFIFGWEPRGEWLQKEIGTICRELEVVHVVDPFKSRQTFGVVSYYRLHGIGGYGYKYTGEDLQTLKGLVKNRKPCYFMFNNVHMLDDAVSFKELTKGEAR